MSDPVDAPASRDEILAALQGRQGIDGYAQRQAIVTWLKDDADGTKATWLGVKEPLAFLKRKSP